jgi:hypothetical protein
MKDRGIEVLCEYVSSVLSEFSFFFGEVNMKKMFFLIAVLILLQARAFSAGDSIWIPTGTVGINASQVAFNDWAQGGENTLSWTFLTNMGLEYRGSPWNLINKLKLAYGQSKIGSDDYKTSDNEIYLESVLSYNVAWAVNPFFSNTVRTTVSSGYNYKDPLSPKIADFFDPGYISQSFGFNYKKDNMLSSRLGIALQETFTSKFRNYSDDPKTGELEAFKLETGIEAVNDFETTLQENLLLQSKLRLFTRFNALDVWDIRFDNLLTAKITEYINVSFAVLVLYEKSMSPKTQLKEALQMGISYALF